MNAQNDLFEGRRRRDKVLDKHVRNRQWLLAQIEQSLVNSLTMASGPYGVTADNAMDALDWLEKCNPDMPKYDRRFLGALWRKPHWQKPGEYVQSRRPERHARPIPVWEYRPEATP